MSGRALVGGVLVRVAVCSLASCSALGLGEYDALACDVPGEVSPCDALNAALPEGQCEKYYCHRETGRGCELRPRDDDGDKHADALVCSGVPGLGDLDCDDSPSSGKERHFGLAERCDGIDNDCDDFIDEDTPPKDEGTAIALTQRIEQLSHVEIDPTADRGALLAVTQPDSGAASSAIEAFVLDGDALLEPRALVPVATPCLGTPHPENCKFAQLAVATAPPRLIAAGIHRRFCLQGQLRVGLGTLEPLDLSLTDAPEQSNVGAGIDVDPISTCTVSTGCAGASDPVLAALPAAREGEDAQALAVWRAPADQGCSESSCAACKHAAHSVLVGIGLFVEERSRSGPLLIGSGGGRAQALGMGAVGAPALVAFSPANTSLAGYVLAYPSTDRVELLFLPRLDVRQPLATGMRSGHIEQPDVTRVTLGTHHDRNGNIDGVALASVVMTQVGSSIEFVELSLTQGEAPHIASGVEPRSLPALGRVVGAPALLHTHEGFSISAAEGSGPEGGWLVLWIEQATEGDETRLMSARIADRDRKVLGDPVELASGDVSLPFAAIDRSTPGSTGLRFGYVHDRELRVRRMTCSRDD
jgi:hypothetical protein